MATASPPRQEPLGRTDGQAERREHRRLPSPRTPRGHHGGAHGTSCTQRFSQALGLHVWMKPIMTRVSARTTLMPTRSARSKRENYVLKPTGNPKGSFEVPLQRDGAESTSPFTHGRGRLLATGSVQAEAHSRLQKNLAQLMLMEAFFCSLKLQFGNLHSQKCVQWGDEAVDEL